MIHANLDDLAAIPGDGVAGVQRGDRAGRFEEANVAAVVFFHDADEDGGRAFFLHDDRFVIGINDASIAGEDAVLIENVVVAVGGQLDVALPASSATGAPAHGTDSNGIAAGLVIGISATTTASGAAAGVADVNSIDVAIVVTVAATASAASPPPLPPPHLP